MILVGERFVGSDGPIAEQGALEFFAAGFDRVPGPFLDAFERACDCVDRRALLEEHLLLGCKTLGAAALVLMKRHQRPIADQMGIFLPLALIEGVAPLLAAAHREDVLDCEVVAALERLAAWEASIDPDQDQLALL